MSTQNAGCCSIGPYITLLIIIPTNGVLRRYVHVRHPCDVISSYSYGRHMDIVETSCATRHMKFQPLLYLYIADSRVVS